MTIDILISDELIPYPEAVTTMAERVKAIQAGTANPLIWFLEHPPLYTKGVSAKDADLLDPKRFPIFDSGRGGQFTYHGPGQLVVYVMLDLKAHGQDLHLYIQKLEQWLINSLFEIGINAERRKGRVGLWISDFTGYEKKIAAIGVRVQKWVSSHGVALNWQPDLSHFDGIVPCGLPEFGVTSLRDQNIHIDRTDLITILRKHFAETFNILYNIDNKTT